MTPERISKLKSISFVWRVEKRAVWRGEKKDQWNKKFELLQWYKEEHGNCLVPGSYSIDSANLGDWVKTQRREYRKLQQGLQSAMTPERIVKLESIGFYWNFSDGKWSKSFELLRKFKEEHGDCLVPSNYLVDGFKLYTWVTTQREQYRKLQKGLQSSVTPDRIAALESIDFVWGGVNGGQWTKNFELLRRQKEEKGYFFAMISTQLGTWVKKQRNDYKKIQNGQQSSLTPEHIEQLESIGFVWDVDQVQWGDYFELLSKYKKAHGDCFVPSNCLVDGCDLNSWTGTQRQEYRKFQDGLPSSMTPERIEQLESIEFSWKYPPVPTEWTAMLDLLRKFKDVTGHCRPAPIESYQGANLGFWAHVQRQEYRKLQAGVKSSMTLERIEKLESLGFEWDSSSSSS